MSVTYQTIRLNMLLLIAHFVRLSTLTCLFSSKAGCLKYCCASRKEVAASFKFKSPTSLRYSSLMICSSRDTLIVPTLLFRGQVIWADARRESTSVTCVLAVACWAFGGPACPDDVVAFVGGVTGWWFLGIVGTGYVVGTGNGNAVEPSDDRINRFSLFSSMLVAVAWNKDKTVRDS